MQEEVCCPKFDPTPWDNKEFNWENKKFIKSNVFSLMYMPLNFGGVISKLMKKVDATGRKLEGNLCLSDHTSKWNMDIYLAVDDIVPEADNVTISGKFVSKVYEGDFKDTGKWSQDFKQYVESKNYKIEKWYMWYTTCPKCAKKYGKNYTVIIAKVK